MEGLFHSGHFYSSVVEEVRNLINEDVILTNNEGIIVSSTDKTRINSFHEGAFLAMKNKKNMVMTERLTTQLKGVRKGVVLPIFLSDKALGVIGITGEPEVVQPYAMLVQKVAELFIQDSMIQANKEKRARELEFFILDWLNSREITISLEERSDLLNINMKKYKRVIVLRADQSTLSFAYKDINLLKTAWDQNGDTLFIRWGRNRIIMLLSDDLDNHLLSLRLSGFIKEIKKTMKILVFAGVGESTDYDRLFLSFEQAVQACSACSKKNLIIIEEELKFELLKQALDPAVKKKFVERTIDSIKEDPVLLETLENWFMNNMSNKNTAEQLHIHKNTLIYRLKRIEELTELNLNKIHDLAILYTGHLFLNELSK